MLAIAFLIGLGSCASGGNQSGALTGTIERVWEDGFAINTGDRTVRVDAWDVCGDNTQQAIAIGDEITVEGQSSGLEFDAFSITNAAGDAVCP